MEKIDKEQFVLQAIKNLRTEKSRGIHAVYSSFNEAFKAYFGEPSEATTTAMVAKGLIETRPANGGPMIYLKGEMPAPNRDKKIAQTLSKILG